MDKIEKPMEELMKDEEFVMLADDLMFFDRRFHSYFSEFIATFRAGEIMKGAMMDLCKCYHDKIVALEAAKNSPYNMDNLFRAGNLNNANEELEDESA